MRKCSKSILVAMILLFLWTEPGIQAQSKLKLPISLAIQESLTNVDSQSVNQKVHLVAQGTFCLKGACIPKGALFEGVVQQVKKSRRFLRPGLIAVSIQKATFPDGGELSFEHVRQLNIRHGEVMTLMNFSKKIAFDLMPEVGLDYTLSRTTSFSPLVQDAISLAPDFVVDYTLETLYPTVPNESKLKRAVFALLDATYIPFFISIIRKDKAIQVSPGNIVQIPSTTRAFRVLLLEAKKNNDKSNFKRNVPFRIECELSQSE